MFTQIKEREKNFVDLSIDLLVGMRDMLQANQTVCVQTLMLIYFSTLFAKMSQHAFGNLTEWLPLMLYCFSTIRLYFVMGNAFCMLYHYLTAI